MSSFPTGNHLHVLHVATGGREFVLVPLGCVQRVATVPAPAMCSVIVPTTDIMSTAESLVENSGQEEELKGTRRKISLFK